MGKNTKLNEQQVYASLKVINSKTYRRQFEYFGLYCKLESGAKCNHLKKTKLRFRRALPFNFKPIHLIPIGHQFFDNCMFNMLSSPSCCTHESQNFQFRLCGDKRVGRGIHERGMNTFLSKVKPFFFSWCGLQIPLQQANPQNRLDLEIIIPKTDLF